MASGVVLFGYKTELPTTFNQNTHDVHNGCSLVKIIYNWLMIEFEDFCFFKRLTHWNFR